MNTNFKTGDVVVYQGQEYIVWSAEYDPTKTRKVKSKIKTSVWEWYKEGYYGYDFKKVIAKTPYFFLWHDNNGKGELVRAHKDNIQSVVTRYKAPTKKDIQQMELGG